MSDRLFPIRSALFMPATKLASLAKVLASDADLVVVDLEDGVAPEARESARSAVARLPEGDRERIALRVNHIATEDGLRDFLMLRSCSTPWAALMLPKVEGPDEVTIAAAHLSATASAIPPIIALVETALGLERAVQTAAHAAVECLALGGADLAANLGVELAWEPLVMARSRLVQAAAIGCCPAWDVPCLSLSDDAALAAETAAASRLGMSGKLAIHPKQVGVINQTLTPSAEAISTAKRILTAFAAAGNGACSLDGRLIDRPIALAARRTLARATGHEFGAMA
ncbi:HpcH/HpaI aldolase/citrate lyase family protein [Chelatococcus asaccharovorans]|uniref:Citrate lyase subunit beta/citryl-CoA lyase/(S)-citramalyl-CoA lyase n=1 Tax=Chelatococcus asaccharovorans TaxID=28210 RepID=A0A2V3U8T7_9HYPH|nr:CoA ester lyase [Chelatococcus asaccharovorans]MBS7705486.1 CoA ester lyase [Chelatococcus asaccharovorans]PXW60109.1 citrate lyase subunit beta/citryl-CoA lyase/(S)-citramalyl-CoA lyase [Chelatococcus asaccharovorans]